MAVRKIQNAYYVSEDVNRAVEFYRDALGLALKFQDGERWAQFDVGGANFSVGSPTEGPPDARGAVVVFEVDDLDAHRSKLEARGARVIDSRDMGAHGRTLTLRDPDGNLVQLFQRAS